MAQYVVETRFRGKERERFLFNDIGKLPSVGYYTCTLMVGMNALMAQGRLSKEPFLQVFEVEHTSVYWGMFTDPERYVDVAYCKEHNIEMVRGVVGFGAAYNDTGCSGCGIFLPWDFCQRHGVETYEDLYAATVGAFAAGYREKFGIDARYRPLNDMEIGGKKVMGSSAFRIPGQGVLNNHFFQVKKQDYEGLVRTMKPPKEKLGDKMMEDAAVEAMIAARSSSLEEAIGREPSFQEWKDALKLGISIMYNVDVVPGDWIPWEYPKELWDLTREAAKKNLTDEFIFGMTESRRLGVIPSDVKKLTNMVKIPHGPLFDITILEEKGAIRDIVIGGSIHMAPIDAITEIEQALKGVSIRDEELVKSRIHKVFEERKAAIGMGSEENLVDAIRGALKKGLE